MMNNRRRKKYLGTSFQRKLLLLVLLSALVPVTIVTVSLYYLIFNMMGRQLAIPEAIAYNLMPVLGKVNLIIILALPLCLIILWIAALQLSHRIAGPLYRVENELEERISGVKQGPIIVRKDDEFRSLVDKINTLIARTKQGSGA